MFAARDLEERKWTEEQRWAVQPTNIPGVASCRRRRQYYQALGNPQLAKLVPLSLAGGGEKKIKTPPPKKDAGRQKYWHPPRPKLAQGGANIFVPRE